MEKDLDKFLENRLLYAKAMNNAKIYESSDGKIENMIEISKLDPRKIKYRGTSDIEQETGLEFILGQFEIELPNGEKTILTVDQDGNSMSCEFLDENGKTEKFLLSPYLQEKILKSAVNGNVKGILDTDSFRETLFPESMEDMEKEIEKDTLIPKSAEETIKKVKEKNPKADIKEEAFEEKENEKTDNEEEVEKINFPKNIKDTVRQVSEEDGGNLKQVLISKDPQSVANQLQSVTGINPNGGPVYILDFSNRDLSTGNDRIVLVQGNRVIDERKNDEPGSNFMSSYRNDKVVDRVEDEKSKIIYTDIDGHTIVGEMQSTPNDISFEKKLILEKELNKIDSKEESLKNSDKPLLEKIDLLNKVNEERLKKFDEFGIKVPNVRGEIEADIEMGGEAVEELKERSEEHEFPEGPWDRR